MGDMGLAGMAGAAGAGDAINTIFQQRLQAAQEQNKQQEFQQNQARLDALMRITADEKAATAREAIKKEADQTAQRQEGRDTASFTNAPIGTDLGPVAQPGQNPNTPGQRMQAMGLPTPIQAGPKVQQTTGFMPLPSGPSGPQGPGLQTISGLTPINGPQTQPSVTNTSQDVSSPLSVPDKLTRGATQADIEKGKADDLASRKADDTAQARQDALELRQHIADISDKVRSGQLNNQEAMLAIRERLATVAEQNANSKAAKGVQLSPAGKSSRAAIEQAGPMTDQAIQMLEQQFPGIDKDPEKYNTAIDKLGSLAGAAKYKAGFSDPNDPRRQITSLLQPVQAGQYMRSSRSRQMLELALSHMADMTQTPAAQYQRLKDLRGLMPEMLEGIVRAEQPVDPSNPLAGSYFDPAKSGGDTGKVTVTAPDGSVHSFDSQSQADAFKKLAGIK